MPKLNLNIPIEYLDDGNFIHIYTPVLDVTSYGKTKEEAEKNFGEVVEILMEELIKRGTLEDVLLNLGWRKEKKEYVPPKTEAGTFSLSRLSTQMA